MTKDEFGMALDRIEDYYPEFTLIADGRYETDAEQDEAGRRVFNLWYERLGSCDYELMVRAIDRYVENNRFSPHICDLRQTATDIFNEDKEAREREYYEASWKKWKEEQCARKP